MVRVAQAQEAPEPMGDLSEYVRFNPQEGSIWLEGERMVLLHVNSLAGLRRELIDHSGTEVARGILMRMGHNSGAIDAALARRISPGAASIEAFVTGPRLHAIEGMVAVDSVGLDASPETGFHMGEWVWRNSAEVEAHLQSYGLSTEPVCWMLLGYASAFASAYMGQPILYREVECRAMGAAHCRIIGKPAAEWQDAGQDDIHQSFELAENLPAMNPQWSAMSGAPEGGGASGRLVGASAGFASILHMIDKVAPTNAAALFIGEPGTGKKSFARLLHRRGKRAAKPLIMFNCAALPGSQLDIELFGAEKSALSASPTGRAGKIEQANGATLLLDDVHRLDPQAQAKLLQVLQTGEVRRAGGAQPRPVDVRLIACATTQLNEDLRTGAFRADLYYRLTMFPIPVSPLRDRRTDLPLLIRHFLEMFAQHYGKQIKGVSEAAIGYLLTHEFPGNIAELESMMERAVIMAADQGAVSVTHLGSCMAERNSWFYGLSTHGQLVSTQANGSAQQTVQTLDRLLDNTFELQRFERDLITRAVERASGNLSKAAKSLGLTRPQLAYRYGKVQQETAE